MADGNVRLEDLVGRRKKFGKNISITVVVWRLSIYLGEKKRELAV
jgi:hypothetical protein